MTYKEEGRGASIFFGSSVTSVTEYPSIIAESDGNVPVTGIKGVKGISEEFGIGSFIDPISNIPKAELLLLISDSDKRVPVTEAICKGLPEPAEFEKGPFIDPDTEDIFKAELSLVTSGSDERVPVTEVICKGLSESAEFGIRPFIDPVTEEIFKTEFISGSLFPGTTGLISRDETLSWIVTG